MALIKNLMIVAGEESGDLHAASFIRELRTKAPDLRIHGIGGKHMQEAGVSLLYDLAHLGVTGISEVVRHFKTIHSVFKEVKRYLSAHPPDLLILVDYPGFNLRLAQFAKEILGLKILYYISPQIWAWKASRIHTIKKCVDHMAVILPFEKLLYENAGVPVSFVGHPLVNVTKPCEDILSTRLNLGLPTDKRIISMLPGSRMHEIKRHMPILRECAIQLSQQSNDLHFAIPIANTIEPKVIEQYLGQACELFTLVKGQAVDTMSCSDAVIVASGTASLESALLMKPMCIIYKGSLLSYLAATQVIQVKYFGLANLLLNTMVVPELLQYDCSVKELTKTVSHLLNDISTIQPMQRNLQKLVHHLSNEKADCSISNLILSLL